MIPEPKIFAVNFSGRDYSSAEEFSKDIVYMTSGVLDLQNYKNYTDKIGSYVNQQSSDIDYLLFSGPHLIAALALHIWLQKHTKCNVLLWNGVQEKYFLRTVS